MGMTQSAQLITTLLGFVMLIVALAISASTTINRMVRFYQLQAWVLAVMVLLTAAEHASFNWPLAAVVILPIFLALTIKPFLGRATLSSAVTNQHNANQPHIRGITFSELWTRTFHARIEVVWDRFQLHRIEPEVELIWLQHGRPQHSQIISIGIDMTLTVVAFIVAYRLVGRGQQGLIDTSSLAVSIALLLLGLFTMSNKQDIIAQIIGLLVMEHGLFLAAIKTIAFSTLAIVFTVSLFFYTIITLVILLWLLPALQHISDSIELEEQNHLKG
jgi:hydrogenase-4 membrane subunit HyfE